MKKILLLTLIGVAVVGFVGTDVVKGALHQARSDIREHLTANVPLEQQLAEAQALVDKYAESVIKGEVAAENLSEMIGQVEREVRVLGTRVERGRESLVMMKRDYEMVPVSTAPQKADRDTLRKVHAFNAQSELLDRRTADLERLRSEYGATVASLEEARTEQMRLADEVHVLAAEIQSLEARTAAARTREAVGSAIVDSSGYAQAQKRLQKIRSSVRERNKLLTYYEFERRPIQRELESAESYAVVNDPREAIDEALAAWPAN